MGKKTEQFTYQGDADKKRLDHFLHEQLPELSRSAIQKHIKSGNVTINDTVALRPHHWLKNNEVITWTNVEIKPQNFNPALLEKIEIIDQTDDYLIISKPAGLLTHPTNNQPNNISLITWLVDNFPQTEHLGEDPLRPALVHRLDKDVSGLMVIPLTQVYFEELKQQFKLRTVNKEYLGLIHGQLEKVEGIIDLPISRSKTTGKFSAHSHQQGGKEAITKYEVVEKFTNYTLLRIIIETGRTNQIRIHFNSLGHSLVGDELYHTKDIIKPVTLGRPFLHAAKLAFEYRGKIVTYELPLPEKLDKFLKSLK
ncbi:MAG: hypothetical protein AUJ28_01060 [Parcubacteria group bacterium CG1_02_37_51]|uniref:Pseudouridine synthase n=2 Tax=Candidatus Komeiliibacteriota TaxID=1817908 RepID=A0A2M8DQ20_9BACT|nr:MAG: hypothetical protein AUJ28_01060 [Parcubacteria group bacterium CG1_02_37_51]PIY95421.1 MAG: RluA family pseudouridine synthase [Candidatus Komeilibacteria bacterium CG_4_10_14_0_8_um_filter_37_78]PJC01010.1 MAG: RluA family pseudouridine synthase [Candidatus Komeilibacteria bacterium CG_4_9_14_0_8_um_filter_36_9]